jgi:hypothetical protein
MVERDKPFPLLALLPQGLARESDAAMWGRPRQGPAAFGGALRAGCDPAIPRTARARHPTPVAAGMVLGPFPLASVTAPSTLGVATLGK